MSNWYASSVAHAAVAQFAISTAYTIGNIVRQLATPAVGSERCFRCTTAGTSAGTEAAWTLTKGATTTQGTAVFTEVTGNETYQAAGAWAAPFARIVSAGASGWCVAGDTIYVAANHAETVGAAVSWAIQGTTGGSVQTNIICVDQSGTGHVPPAAGDIRATATFTITGNFALSLNAGNLYCYGIIFNLQSGGNNNQLNALGATFASTQRFEACAFNLLSSANSGMQLNLTTGGSIEWINTTLQFGNINATMTVRGRFVWRDTPSAVSGSAPTGSGLLTDGGNTANILFDGVDLSGAGAARIVALNGQGGRFLATNCKLSATFPAPTAGLSNNDDIRVDYINCDSAGSTIRCESNSGEMIQTTESAAVRTGGASDGSTAYSWKCATYTDVKWQTPGACFPIAQWNASTGSSKTVSFEAIVNAAAVLNNDQLWMDVHYLGTASSTLASLASSTKANFLATAAAVTVSTAAWDSLLTARANSTAKSLGDIISVASNSGRAFFCTTAGTTSASLPAGYATAVDGGSVTDGTAVFRAGCRMTVSLSITPQVAGLIRATPKLGVASTTCYIDPLLSVT